MGLIVRAEENSFVEGSKVRDERISIIYVILSYVKKSGKNKVVMLWYIESFHCLKISKRNVYFELFFIVSCVSEIRPSF